MMSIRAVTTTLCCLLVLATTSFAMAAPPASDGALFQPGRRADGPASPYGATMEPSWGAWASVAFGASTVGLAGEIDLAGHYGPQLFMLRTFATEELEIFGFAESVGDVALLYGVTYTGDLLHASAAIGPGYVTGEHQGPCEESDGSWFSLGTCEALPFATAGAAIDTKLLLELGGVLGLGVRVNGTLNPERSATAAMVVFELGKLD